MDLRKSADFEYYAGTAKQAFELCKVTLPH